MSEPEFLPEIVTAMARAAWPDDFGMYYDDCMADGLTLLRRLREMGYEVIEALDDE